MKYLFGLAAVCLVGVITYPLWALAQSSTGDFCVAQPFNPSTHFSAVNLAELQDPYSSLPVGLQRVARKCEEKMQRPTAEFVTDADDLLADEKSTADVAISLINRIDDLENELNVVSDECAVEAYEESDADAFNTVLFLDIVDARIAQEVEKVHFASLIALGADMEVERNRGLVEAIDAQSDVMRQTVGITNSFLRSLYNFNNNHYPCVCRRCQ